MLLLLFIWPLALHIFLLDSEFSSWLVWQFAESSSASNCHLKTMQTAMHWCFRVFTIDVSRIDFVARAAASSVGQGKKFFKGPSINLCMGMALRRGCLRQIPTESVPLKHDLLREMRVPTTTTQHCIV
ncbi:hypothetical protein XELAEV_18013765mg [Xenopus laevis]|uniref:Secreted protein n=1 Tax=Xenopus laevis TaxID=8355 RepID=A0A974DQC6_XENLA|nr:hypothetical protein XELAEV_18013765mg [Xenopus laevis]